jgi:UTP--glucose-1-phosphate uridylyltransferase
MHSRRLRKSGCGLHKVLDAEVNMEVRKAVLPVAGLGTRFLPATKAQPKEMLPVVDKPLVQYGVEEVQASGIPLAIFVTGRGKDAIEDHFDVSFELEHMLAGRGKEELLAQVRSISRLVQIIYVRQKNPLGLGHAILVAKDMIGDEPFAVLLSDDIIDAEVPCLKQMIDVFSRYGRSVVAIQRVEKSAVSSYGIIKGDPVVDHAWKDRLFRITNMVEKPEPRQAPSNLAIIGRYILTPAIFQELVSTRRGAGSEIQLTDALHRLLAKEPIYGYVFEGTRYDAGDKLGFLQATVEMALKRPELGKPFRRYLKALKL